ncbi:hypothetical protein VNO78_19199 [Psophocarpus tetragonolobus]|uniref:Uncharacterized protein n=1 Tax=Psophocarpus tetragonolobus TaxID=3891 RepID=A0AAN9S8E2_PSOTE
MRSYCGGGDASGTVSYCNSYGASGTLGDGGGRARSSCDDEREHGVSQRENRERWTNNLQIVVTDPLYYLMDAAIGILATRPEQKIRTRPKPSEPRFMLQPTFNGLEGFQFRFQEVLTMLTFFSNQQDHTLILILRGDSTPSSMKVYSATLVFNEGHYYITRFLSDKRFVVASCSLFDE